MDTLTPNTGKEESRKPSTEESEAKGENRLNLASERILAGFRQLHRQRPQQNQPAK